MVSLTSLPSFIYSFTLLFPSNSSFSYHLHVTPRTSSHLYVPLKNWSKQVIVIQLRALLPNLKWKEKNSCENKKKCHFTYSSFGNPISYLSEKFVISKCYQKILLLLNVGQKKVRAFNLNIGMYNIIITIYKLIIAIDNEAPS